MFKDLEFSFDFKGFPQRMAAVVGREKSVNSFAQRAGVTEGTVRNYLKGMTKPTRLNLEAIARTAGVSLVWLISGEGDMADASYQGTGGRTLAALTTPQAEVLQQVVTLLATLEQKHGAILSPQKRATLTAMAFDAAVQKGGKATEADLRPLFNLAV